MVEAMICGYHEYQSIWQAEVGENLNLVQGAEAKRVTRRHLLAQRY